MAKKTTSKKSVIVRVGTRVTDGHKGGVIIAVSGQDVALQWDNGVIEQKKWDDMAHYQSG